MLGIPAQSADELDAFWYQTDTTSRGAVTCEELMAALEFYELLSEIVLPGEDTQAHTHADTRTQAWAHTHTRTHARR